MVIGNSSFLFNERVIKYTILRKERGIVFGINHSYLEEINSIIDKVDTLVINIGDTYLRYERCCIRNVYEYTNMQGMMEVVFQTNTPIEKCRELKLKTLLEP